MSERWQQYIFGGVDAAGGPEPFALTQWMFLFPLFLAIRRALPSGGRILDVGCGAGIFTSLLAHHGYDVTGVDNDAEIVEYAGRMVEYLRSPARLERSSAFDLSAYHGRFDLAFSLGLVEHFDADTTVSLISEQAKCARTVAVVIPSRHLRRTGAATDERFYSLGELEGLVKRAGCSVRESFVFGEVPTVTARNAERLLPAAVYRRLQRWLTYGMDVCVVGEKR